ncbi:MAG: class I SAM-dependent methyltransferase [Betaproteobacteria bacterium]
MSEYTGTENLEIMAEAVNYNRYLLSLIRASAQPGDRIADIGAGIGTFARALAAEGLDVTCVEPDARQLRVIADAGLPAVDAVESLADASFDFIYSLNVLEHIDDDRAAAATWVSKLKPGGRMLVYVPAFQVLFSSLDRRVEHRRRYRRRMLADVMRSAGLRVDRVRYADSAGFFATLVFKAIGNDHGTINRQALVMFDRFAFPLGRVADLALDRIVGKNVVLTGVRA